LATILAETEVKTQIEDLDTAIISAIKLEIRRDIYIPAVTDPNV
jgi:hypothetical protein